MLPLILGPVAGEMLGASSISPIVGTVLASLGALAAKGGYDYAKNLGGQNFAPNGVKTGTKNFGAHKSSKVFNQQPQPVAATEPTGMDISDAHDAGNISKPSVASPTPSQTPTTRSNQTYNPNAPARMKPKARTQAAPASKGGTTTQDLLDAIIPTDAVSNLIAASQADLPANDQMILRAGANPDTSYADAAAASQAVDPNYQPVMRSAGMSPDTSYGAVNDLMAQQGAEQAQADQAAAAARYQQLMDMYGITPTSGVPSGIQNQDAANAYYNDPTKYEALARVFGW